VGSFANLERVRLTCHEQWIMLRRHETLTLDQAISDTIELSEYLRAPFDEPKIYMIGESWGSRLGVLAAQRRPDLYYAVIGSGEMASHRTATSSPAASLISAR
jgi:hypothetical protein